MADSRLGGGGSAGKKCGVRRHAAGTGRRWMNRAKARWVQPVEVGADRGVPGVGRDDQLRARERLRRAPRVLDRGPEVVGPLHQQHGHVRVRARAEVRCHGRRRPALAQLERVARQRGGAVEGRERGVRDGGRVRGGQAMPLRRVGRRGARPRHGHLLARRGGVHGGAELARGRRLGVDLGGAPPQTKHRRDVAVQGRLDGAGECGAQRRVEVARQEHREEVHTREPVAAAAARGRPRRSRAGRRRELRSSAPGG